jgi:hypothetical protein
MIESHEISKNDAGIQMGAIRIIPPLSLELAKGEIKKLV